MNELYPDFFARFYDLIYHQMRDDADNEFYLSRIRETKGKVLEVGTGTGRLFTKALAENADIYGIDISPAMLDVLKSKLTPAQSSRVSLQNIVDFRLNERFDLVIAPFRVFMHVTDKKDQLRALDNIWNHLASNGKFIFDLFVPDLKPLISGLDNVTDFEGEYEPGKLVTRTVSTKPDLINQLIKIVFRIEWDDATGHNTRYWNSTMRFFFRYEIEHLIERSKFRRYSISGDFSGNKLDNNSKEFIITCFK